MQRSILARSADVVVETRDRISILRTELRDNDHMVRTSRIAIRESMEAIRDLQLWQVRGVW